MASSLLGLSNTFYFHIEMFVYALIGGVLPALVWLWFWMHESYRHDEPKFVITMTFLFGMVAVFAVYPLQVYLPGLLHVKDSPLLYTTTLAFFEELVKYLAAFALALGFKKVFNEPIDAFIYLMTAALGFVAMENTFYILSPLINGDPFDSLITGNFRFLGASLLHVVASGVLSVFISYAFYKGKWIKLLFVTLGLIVATLLHTAFNYFIIIQAEDILVIFSYVWLTTILLILALERVKKIKQF